MSNDRVHRIIKRCFFLFVSSRGYYLPLCKLWTRWAPPCAVLPAGASATASASLPTRRAFRPIYSPRLRESISWRQLVLIVAVFQRSLNADVQLLWNYYDLLLLLLRHHIVDHGFSFMFKILLHTCLLLFVIINFVTNKLVYFKQLRLNKYSPPAHLCEFLYFTLAVSSKNYSFHFKRFYINYSIRHINYCMFHTVHCILCYVLYCQSTNKILTYLLTFICINLYGQFDYRRSGNWRRPKKLLIRVHTM